MSSSSCCGCCYNDTTNLIKKCNFIDHNICNFCNEAYESKLYKSDCMFCNPFELVIKQDGSNIVRPVYWNRPLGNTYTIIILCGNLIIILLIMLIFYIIINIVSSILDLLSQYLTLQKLILSFISK